MVRSLMLDYFSLSLVLSLNTSSSDLMIYYSLDAYKFASYSWSCWICWDNDCSLFIAFLLVEFISWLSLSFSLKSCLICSINLVKLIFASFVLVKINEMISVLFGSVVDFFIILDVLSLFSWGICPNDFLP